MLGPCSCLEPGHCPGRGIAVSRIGYRVCRAGDPEAIRRYFDRPARTEARRGPTASQQRARVESPCVHLGAPVLDEAGGQVLRDCATCQGTVRLKVLDCSHPAHPDTTLKSCKTCPDYAAPIAPDQSDQPADSM